VDVSSPDTTVPAQLAAIKMRDEALRDAVRTLRVENRSPLFVWSAGNGVDARLAGYVGARESFPSQVIVVGALAHSISAPGQANQLASFSNRGTGVDIYAPGENIGALGAGRRLKLVIGQSVTLRRITVPRSITATPSPGTRWLVIGRRRRFALPGRLVPARPRSRRSCWRAARRPLHHLPNGRRVRDPHQRVAVQDGRFAVSRSIIVVATQARIQPMPPWFDRPVVWS
jgi:hypothetical protein